MSTKRSLLLLALALLIPAEAQASSCNVAVTPLNFGTYLPFSRRPVDSTGDVTVSCSGYTGSYAITLNAGLYSGGSFANRKLSNGRFYLTYQLYVNAARSTVWGDGTGGSVGVPMASMQGVYTVYGRIPASQAVSAGSYTDTILVTILF